MYVYYIYYVIRTHLNGSSSIKKERKAIELLDTKLASTSHILVNKILLVSKRTDNISYKILSLKLPPCINRFTNNIIATSWVLKLRVYTSYCFNHDNPVDFI